MVVAIMGGWASVVYIVGWFQEHLGCSISTANPVDVYVPHPGSQTVHSLMQTLMVLRN